MNAEQVVDQDVFAPKVVNWETVRDIANRLTNQLLCVGEGVDLAQVHMSNFNQGPRRQFTLEEGRQGHWRQAGNMGGWWAFDEADVSRLYWQSLTSGNSLEATKLSPGKWELRYVPSPTDPGHRGLYYGMWQNPESVQNLAPEPSRPRARPVPYVPQS